MNAQSAIAIARETTAVDHVDMTEMPPASTALTPMQMAYQLAARGADVSTIKEMLALGREAEADAAERAFNAAFADFKAEAITVLRTREVTDGPLKGRRYAELYSFVNAATPALSKHGLSASWSVTRDDKDWIEVTCTLKHALGGKESVSQGGPPDNGGAKNALQARISTVTYLERATFKAICGLAEQGDDTDGNPPRSTAEPLTEKQVMDLNDLLEETAAGRPNHKKAFLDYMKVERLDDIPGRDYRRAIDAINSTRVKP